jgi:hypothetical protein
MAAVDNLLHEPVYIRHPGNGIRDHQEMGRHLHLLPYLFSRSLNLLKQLGLEVGPEFIPGIRTALVIVFILALTWLLMHLSRRVIRIFKKFAIHHADDPEEVRRVETLSQVIRYLLSIVIVVMAVLLVLSELGISIAPFARVRYVGTPGFGAARSRISSPDSSSSWKIRSERRCGQYRGESGQVEEVTAQCVCAATTVTSTIPRNDDKTNMT